MSVSHPDRGEASHCRPSKQVFGVFAARPLIEGTDSAVRQWRGNSLVKWPILRPGRASALP